MREQAGKGVELRPGEPYVHRHPPSLGRLCITKAEPVNKSTAERTMVQCIVGNSAPIIICSLNPGLVEMCHLELEYQENDEVHFSVLGIHHIYSSFHFCVALIMDLDSSLLSLNHVVTRESEGEDVGGEYESDRETSESHGGDVGGEYESDRETIESHGGDVGEYNSDWEYLHVSEDVSEDSSESDVLDDGDVEVPDNAGVSESMHDGDMYSTADRRQESPINCAFVENHQVDSLDDNIHSSPCKPAVRHNTSSMFNSGSEDKDFVTQSEGKSANMHVSLSKKINGKVSDEIEPEKFTSHDETEKEINAARKRKSDAINQDSASPVYICVSLKVTMVNGSSIPELEPEKKSPLEPEYGKRSKNIRTLEDGLIIEDLSATDMGRKVTMVNGSSIPELEPEKKYPTRARIWKAF
uniref:peptidylprolyl isomerase n=1 Tax=Aegilops tauschii TaxID=37682 RepID=M8BXH5_AEGTA